MILHHECCPYITNFYSELYRYVAASSSDLDAQVTLLSELLPLAKITLDQISQKIKCNKIICCQEIISALLDSFKIYIKLTNKILSDLVLTINAILVSANFSPIIYP